MDAARLELCFVDSAFSGSQRMLRLEPGWKGEARSLTSVALTREESALMLLDGSILTLTDAEGARELRGILQLPAARVWLSLARYALYALAAAAFLWLNQPAVMVARMARSMAWLAPTVTRISPLAS